MADAVPFDPQVTVVVEDVVDPRLVAKIQAAIQTVFRALDRRDRWIIAIAASDARGRWDMAIKGPGGRHLLSFAAAPEQMADVAAGRVRRALLHVG